MRKLTKANEDITELFPDLTDENNPQVSAKWFDIYDRIAQNQIANIDKKQFTKDDILDAFMYGASTAHKEILNFYFLKLESLKYYKQLKQYIDDFLKRQNNGSN